MLNGMEDAFIPYFCQVFHDVGISHWEVLEHHMYLIGNVDTTVPSDGHDLNRQQGTKGLLEI